MTMKYMISWFERPQGSPMEYENAQKRILEVFTQWKAPDNFKIELFVIRVGDWGGYMLLDCDDPLAVHKFCSMLPAFEFQARPVVLVGNPIRLANDGESVDAHARWSMFSSCCGQRSSACFAQERGLKRKSWSCGSRSMSCGAIPPRDLFSALSIDGCLLGCIASFLAL